MKKIFFFVFSLFMGLSFYGQTADLSVTLKAVKHNEGRLYVSLYTPKDDFMKTAYRRESFQPVRGKFKIVFRDLPKGKYAVIVHHDENNDSITNRNLIGIPTEGYGFSQNPTLMRKPRFSDGELDLNNDLSIEIKMKY